MPACYIKGCNSRTENARAKNIKLFRFPKEEVIRQQWLEACKRNEVNIKINSARICNLHFEENCFEMKRTKPRTKKIAKDIRRLKKDAVPSKLLNVTMKETGVTKVKSILKTGVPTYVQLLKYAQEQQHIHEKVQNVTEIITEKQNTQQRGSKNDTCELDMITDTRDKTTTKQNVSILMDLLEKEKKEKEKLIKEKNQILKEKYKLIENNIKLSQQVENLQKDVEEKSKLLTEIVINKQKEDVIPLHALRKVFTPGQIKMLMSQKTNTRITWSSADIVSAIALRSLSPKAYRYLRNTKKMPLPCETTLRNWCASFRIPPGILTDVLQIMNDKGQSFSLHERLTVLTFDELYVSNKIEIERKEQRIYGSHKTCQFVLARGLFCKWKQPIYYEFDKPMSADTLLTIINRLYEINYTVLAVISDMGPANMKLWNNLNIGINVDTNTSKKNEQEIIEKQNYITHPSNSSLKIFFYADAPHLIKLARNNFLDSGFKTNGIDVDKTCLEEILRLNSGDLKIAHKLSRAHLDIKGAQRQNVKMAAQVFSNTNALAIRWCGEKNLLTSPQWKQTADILKLFNDWFDIFNSNFKFGHCTSSHAYGINIDEQNKIIANMNEFILEMRVGRRSTLLQFQKGILVCNKSLIEMFPYILEKYSSEEFPIKYLLTRRLNQDVLENLFSYLRMMGAGYDHPTPVQLKYRLRWYILGKHSEYVTLSANTIGDNSTILTEIDEAHNNVHSQATNLHEEEIMDIDIQEVENNEEVRPV